MTIADDLNLSVTRVATDIGGIANDITAVITLLANAGSNDPAVAAATVRLNDAATALETAKTALEAALPPPAP